MEYQAIISILILLLFFPDAVNFPPPIRENGGGIPD
jgi:hypothetical protein